MTKLDPIDYSTYTTPDPSESLTSDILERVGREAAVASRAVPRIAVVGAVVVAAAAAAVLVWKLRADDGAASSRTVATDDTQTEKQPDPDLDPTPDPDPTPAPMRPRRISPDERTRLLSAIAGAHEQRGVGASVKLVLSRADIQAAMQELRPLIDECHEMALERTPTLAGVLKVKMTFVGEPGMATIVAEAEAVPGADLAADAEFLECVTETILSIELAAPAAAGTVGVTYPFVFRAPEDDPPAPGPTHRLPPSEPGTTAAELTNLARGAAKSGEWGKALRLVQQALEQEPDSQDALMLGVLAACNLQNADRAQDFGSRLSSPTRRGMARQSCLKQGVEIEIP